MPLVRTIAVINQKGGVGKTTTVANLGAAVAARGRATCLIDLDPQAHLTLHLGVEPGKPPVSLYDVLTGEAALASAVMSVGPNLWLAPSVIDLAAAETELVTTVGREQILHDRIVEHPLPYEIALIDCPPSLGLLTLNALAAADDMLIPVQPHFLALQGLGKLLETANLVRRRINPRLRVSGVVLCLYEQNTRLAAEVLADLEGFFQAARDTDTPWSRTRIFRTAIRRNIKLAECPSHGRTIFDYEPSCRGAQDYSALGEEFLAWADGRPWQPDPERAILAAGQAPPPDAKEETPLAAEDAVPCEAPHAADTATAETPAPVADVQPPPQQAPPIAPLAPEPPAAPPGQEDRPAEGTYAEEKSPAAEPPQADAEPLSHPLPASAPPAPQDAPMDGPGQP